MSDLDLDFELAALSLATPSAQDSFYLVQSGNSRRGRVSHATPGSIIADPPSGDASGVTDLAMLQAVADECFGTAASPHGASYHLNKRMILPPGNYIVSAPLQFKWVYGGFISGMQRFATKIRNPNGTGVIATNGFQYSYVGNMWLSGAGTTATVFDLNWDGTGPAALQSNTLDQLYISGSGTGLDIGQGQYMGSETEIRDCFFDGHAIAGIRTANYNALGNIMIGGNIQSCAIGVWIYFGAINLFGTGFQGSTVWDVKAENSSYDTLVISGVRTESANFFFGQSTRPVKIDACNQISATSGIFAEHDGPLSIDCCVSVNGRIKPYKIKGTISNSNFDRSDWIDMTSLDFTRLELCNIRYGAGLASIIDRQRINLAGTYDYDVGSSVTELTTIAASAFTDTTIQIPAGTRVKGVTTRVTTAIPTATTFDVGVSGATTRYATGVAVAVNTTDRGMLDGNTYYAAAVSIRITPSATPAANTGRVRVTIYYETLTPPTS